MIRPALCLTLACGVIATPAVAARRGTKTRPVVSHYSPGPSVAVLPPDNPLPPAGRNRLHVLLRLPPRWGGAAVTVLIKRRDETDYHVATFSPSGPRLAPQVVVGGLGRGPYHVAAVLNWSGASETPLDWGPVVMNFPSRAGSRRYWELRALSATSP